MAKNYFILGATSGIGYAVAVELLNQGNSVFGVGRNLDDLQKLQSRFPKQLHVERFDLRQDSPQEMIRKATELLGRLDVIFLNSGTAAGRDFKNWPDMKETLDVNVVGTTEFLFEAQKYFLKENDSGVIAVNTSIAGLRGMRQSTIYSATKAYLITLCQSLRIRLRKKRSKIKIVDIRPGFVQTKMSGGTFWVAPADKAAKQIIRAMDQGKEIVYVTKRWIIIAVLMRLIPRFIWERM